MPIRCIGAIAAHRLLIRLVTRQTLGSHLPQNIDGIQQAVAHSLGLRHAEVEVVCR
jgi:hypothetical protein